MTLEEEAIQHTFKDNLSWENDYAKDAFISGANSKWVQAEKIKAQIEVIDSFCKEHYLYGGNFHKKKITELKQQLKQLEDESKTEEK